MRLWLIVVAVTLGLGALTPSTAAAENTVSFSVSPEPTVGQPVSIPLHDKGFDNGRSRTRTWDLFLIREAL